MSDNKNIKNKQNIKNLFLYDLNNKSMIAGNVRKFKNLKITKLVPKKNSPMLPKIEIKK
tara:strand:+ start:370 stop:546 length:177 start_codon:yes stop_codon:yes gene_type:complete